MQLHNISTSHDQSSNSANVMVDILNGVENSTDIKCETIPNNQRRCNNIGNSQRPQRMNNLSSSSVRFVRYNRRNNPELEKRRIHHCEFSGEFFNEFYIRL